MAASRDECAGCILEDSYVLHKNGAGAVSGFSLYKMGTQRFRKACRPGVL